MTFFVWSQFAIVCIAGAMSPGPSLAIVIRNNVNFNRLAGILTSIGHGIGIGVYATLAVLGLGLILQTNQTVFMIIQIIGLVLLFLFGLMFVFQKNKQDKKEEKQSQLNSFLQGFTIAIINPKILIWFTAVYSQFIAIDASFYFNSILVLTASLIDAIWYIIVSILVTGYGLKNLLIEKKLMIQKTTGIVLIIISLMLLYRII
ncbi:LysE family translocator [Alphaproteobacteria bacterium]|jgi:threonine/homoserine/homoserine lactone efflux protein|nr:LysE family translocator [Alphaproteobacteria bacterium]|tara:strand:+ start:868 stop:1476 length:609 start_codon:yes stop_codon:yes gene_type:complete